MSINVHGTTFDTMGEACQRLGIHRNTMLNYIRKKMFSEPPTIKQGAAKRVRYFPEEWYQANEHVLRDEPDANNAEGAPEDGAANQSPSEEQHTNPEDTPDDPKA